MRRSRAVSVAASAVIALGMGPIAVWAEQKPVGWSASLNLSGVATTGNTETSSFAAQTAVNRNWLRTFFYVTGGGLRQDAVEVTKHLEGTSIDSATEVEVRNRSTKAENYFAETGFERRMTERFLFHLGSGYERNLFNGVQRKVSARAGVGYVRTSAEQEFKFELLATYTDQKEQVPDPKSQDQFAGVRATVDYDVKFGRSKSNTFTTKLAIDQNLEVGEDLRTTWDNVLNVGLTDWLSLQLSTKTAYRNLPSRQKVDLIDPATGKVIDVKQDPPPSIPYGKLDNQFQVSLVISWTQHRPSASRPTP
jgi:hypothetical protein